MKQNKRLPVIAGGMTLALFFAQAALMMTTLTRLSGVGAAYALSALFALPALAAMAGYAALRKPDAKEMLFVSGFVACTMLARVAMLDFVSADYASFLMDWVQAFREGGVALLAENVGDYNLIYQYLLLGIAKTPLPDLYLIKLATVIFDYLLALSMMRAAEHFAGKASGLPVFCLTLILPTVLLDGACWGQCDAIYVTFIVLSLLLLKKGRPSLSAASLAVAFAFKLQTIFFFPVVLLGLIHGEYKLRHALVFFATYIATMVPALLAGRGFVDAIAVYANQSMGQYYDRLTYTAPNLYQFFPMMEFANNQEFMWLRYVPGIENKAYNDYLNPDLFPDLQQAALYACVLLVLAVVIYWLVHYKEITPDMTLDFALFFAIFLPFVMPKIHERYFFLADMLSIVYAARYRERRYVPLLVVGASLMSYVPYLMRQRPIDERWLALMMLAALVVVSRDLLGQMRANRAAMKGGEAA